jgi:hypothetical protein
MRIPLPQFSTDNRHPHHIGEVIETSTTEFVAQCLEPEDLTFPTMPPFGSWVKSLDEESGNRIIAIVTYMTTSPIDSIHRARALGLSLTELREQQPQIFAMLKTEFRATIIGFETKGNLSMVQVQKQGLFISIYHLVPLKFIREFTIVKPQKLSLLPKKQIF